jgi:hypothetical protein
MIHQQPPIESPATQALPVQPGRSSQKATASALSRVDVARLCERLDCLADKMDQMGIPRSTVAQESSTASVETLMARIEILRGLFAERIGDFPVSVNAQTPNHVN